ncbi:Multidrug resistance protein NorM [Photobacterium aquimaris]|uniref:Multidrug resistance protein NorM n=1 Tax=Photobacterium aquimaris TaxID=512643 RepID=A0A1Y6KTG1_9GAMM|nr:MATE family efflux transporter [Photobacterium aquimaris]SMY15381.1 Multidrug resistance protein NorM [Photobacterium aquimaris]
MTNSTLTLNPLFQIFDREFLKRLTFIALPIILQSILFSSKGLIDILMLSQLSEVDIAAMGIAAKALFVTTILLSGIATGGGILSAQYWGVRNENGIKQSTALSLFATVSFAALFCFIFFFYPHLIMGIATSSDAIIERGSEYLTIVGISLFSSAIIVSFTASFRSIAQPKISTFFSACGIVCNIFLNWVLIFGHLGAPALGIKGAAIATLISGIIEVLLLWCYLFITQHLLKLNIKDFNILFSFSKLKLFSSLSLPTTCNFLLWSIGIFSYHALMGATSVEGLAALSVLTPIESISLSFLVGIANASAVIIGNELGAKRYQTAYYQAMLLTIIAIFITSLVAIILFLSRYHLVMLFSALTLETRALAITFIEILSIGIVLRSLPTTLVVGVLRAGGDVKFCLYQDLLTQWAFGIPLAIIGVFVFHLPPQWIYMLFFAETLFKWGACIYRFKSKKWLNTLID